MKALSNALNSFFKPASTRPVDAFRKSRSVAQKLALKYGVEIERLKGGGFNVWPPKLFVGKDPLEGDHFSHNWNDVLASVEDYIAVIDAAQVSSAPS